MKVGISDSACDEILECGTCPAVFTATVRAQRNCSGSYPRFAQKIQMSPTRPAMAAAKATRTPSTTNTSRKPVTIRPMSMGSIGAPRYPPGLSSSNPETVPASCAATAEASSMSGTAAGRGEPDRTALP